MPETKYTIADMIKSANEKEASAFADQFADQMLNRIHQLVQNKRLEVAGNMFNQAAESDVDDSEEYETDETDEELEDEEEEA